MVCYAATQLATQLHKRRLQVVRFNMVSRKRTTGGWRDSNRFQKLAVEKLGNSRRADGDTDEEAPQADVPWYEGSGRGDPSGALYRPARLWRRTYVRKYMWVCRLSRTFILTSSKLIGKNFVWRSGSPTSQRAATKRPGASPEHWWGRPCTVLGPASMGGGAVGMCLWAWVSECACERECVSVHVYACIYIARKRDACVCMHVYG